MLSVRPQNKTASGPTASHGSGTTAFVSTVVPPEQLGLNPLKKTYPVSRAVSLPSDNVTWRHKQWLNEFSAKKMEAEDLAQLEYEKKLEAKKKFSQRQANLRSRVRGTAPKTTSSKKTAGKVPAWAMTEEAADEFKEDEVDELLAFTEGLDFDQYIENMEVTEALKVVQDKIADQERKDRLYAARTDFGEGNYDPPDTTEMDKLRALKKKLEDRLEDRPDWNNSTRIEGDNHLAETAMLENKALGKVHSKQSAAKLVQQARLQNQDNGIQEGIILPNPTIAVAEAPSGQIRKTRASNLPFLYRHPAI
jgi:hypothetical protein